MNAYYRKQQLQKTSAKKVKFKFLGLHALFFVKLRLSSFITAENL